MKGHNERSNAACAGRPLAAEPSVARQEPSDNRRSLVVDQDTGAHRRPPNRGPYPRTYRLVSVAITTGTRR